MGKDYSKHIRKPLAPPTKVFKSIKDYNRATNTVTDVGLEEALSELEGSEILTSQYNGGESKKGGN